MLIQREILHGAGAGRNWPTSPRKGPRPASFSTLTNICTRVNYMEETKFVRMRSSSTPEGVALLEAVQVVVLPLGELRIVQNATLSTEQMEAITPEVLRRTEAEISRRLTEAWQNALAKFFKEECDGRQETADPK